MAVSSQHSALNLPHSVSVTGDTKAFKATSGNKTFNVISSGCVVALKLISPIPQMKLEERESTNI